MSECVLWTGYVAPEGYGFAGKRRAHRVAYEESHGHIPDRMVIDHICHNEAAKRGECAGGNKCQHRRCVNPEHLEAKTDQENIAAGALGYAVRTRCRAGKHDITNPATWYVGAHGRQCRGCIQDRHRERARKRKSERAKLRGPVEEKTDD